jgi:hypothetical protein
LPRKVSTTLRLLVENAGRLLTREQLLKETWPDVALEEGDLSRINSILKKAPVAGADAAHEGQSAIDAGTACSPGNSILRHPRRSEHRVCERQGTDIRS